jgi:hypothetical protein
MPATEDLENVEKYVKVDQLDTAVHEIERIIRAAVILIRGQETVV